MTESEGEIQEQEGNVPFQELSFGQQRRWFLLGLLGIALEACSERGGSESTPTPASLEPHVPEPLSIAERALEQRPIGGIEGELVEVSFNGESQKVMKYIGADGRPFFALSIYPKQGPQDSSAKEQFESQNVLFPSENGDFAFMLLRRTPDEVSSEALPFYDKTTDKMLWVKDNQRLKDEEAFLSLNKGESLVFDEEIGVYWIMDASRKNEAIKVYEPGPMRIELTVETIQETLKAEGTGWEEIRENTPGVLEIGRNFDGKWIHLGYVLREAPQIIWQDGQLLKAKYDSQNPLVVAYLDKDGVEQGWLSLLYGLNFKLRGMEEYQNLIEEQGYYFSYDSKEEGKVEVSLVNKEGERRTIEATTFSPYVKRRLTGFGVGGGLSYEIAGARVDRLTWINGELTLLDSNGNYMNEAIFKAHHNSLKEPRVLPGSMLEKLFDLLDEEEIEEQVVWQNGLKENRLTEKGWQLARQINEIWQGMDYPPLVLKRPADATKYIDLPGIFVKNFTPEQEAELWEAVRMMKELFGRIFANGPKGVGSYAAGDIKFALSVAMLLSEDTRQRLCRNYCRPAHPELVYFSTPEESLRGCAFFNVGFEWSKNVAHYGEYAAQIDYLRKVIQLAAISHEGAHIRKKVGAGVSYPRSNMVTARAEQAFLDCYKNDLTSYQQDSLLNLVNFNISMA